jgi:hypothetical protein
LVGQTCRVQSTTWIDFFGNCLFEQVSSVL